MYDGSDYTEQSNKSTTDHYFLLIDVPYMESSSLLIKKRNVHAYHNYFIFQNFFSTIYSFFYFDAWERIITPKVKLKILGQKGF